MDRIDPGNDRQINRGRTWTQKALIIAAVLIAALVTKFAVKALLQHPTPQPSPPQASASADPGRFDVAGARAAGYTDDEIADYLAKRAGYDVAAARRAGLTSAEIISRLNR